MCLHKSARAERVEQCRPALRCQTMQISNLHACKKRCIPVLGCADNVIRIIQDGPLGESPRGDSKLMVLHGDVVPGVR